MGSINCKEYAPTAGNNNSSCDNQAASGTTGSYQTTSDCNISKATEPNNMAEYTQAVPICNVSDLEENSMKQYEFIENTKVLMIKQNGVVSAIGNKCTHYGAPLHTGALGQGRVRCPWHGACFDIETGDIEDFPGLDSIPCYKVEVSLDGQVKVCAKLKDVNKSKRLKDMVARDPENQSTFVIVGGGPAGGVCAETLRQEGFTGRIVMICREQYLPYDRIKISKILDSTIESLQFRNAAFYEEHNIETMLGVEATKLNAADQIVDCSNGYQIKYDKIFIATGMRAIKPPINGADLRNVVTIRDLAEANAIHKLVDSHMNVVCLGSSFIALEAAASLVKKVQSMTVVGRENVPLKASFGEAIGGRVLKLYQDNNVKMLMNSGITDIIGDDSGAVKEVVLKNGDKIPCELLIMGTGARCYTEFLQGSGVNLNANGSIDVDMKLRSNIKTVFVGGDIANAPVYSLGNEKATIGHLQLAQYHGRIAAIQMADTEARRETVGELKAVPFFFTMIFGKGFRYSGYGDYKSVHIDGDLEKMVFAAYFLNADNYVVAVASCGRDPIVAQFAELQSQGKKLHKSDVDKENATEWTQMLKTPPVQ